MSLAQKITDDLLHNGGHFARLAFERYVSGNTSEQALIASTLGLALEYFLKYSLAKTSLGLIAADNAMKIELTLSESREDLRFSQGKTISMKDAADLLDGIYPGLNVSTSVDKISKIRNAAIHLGFVDQNEIENCLFYFVQSVDQVSKRAEISLEGFWGTYNQLASGIKDRNRDAVKRRVKQKIANFKMSFNTKDMNLDMSVAKEAHEIKEAQVIGSVERSIDNYQLTEKCPSCGYQAELLFNVTLLPQTFESHPNKGLNFQTSVRFAYPSIELLRCLVCDLQLNAIEMAAIGIERNEAPLTEMLDPFDALEDEDGDAYFGR